MRCEQLVWRLRRPGWYNARLSDVASMAQSEAAHLPPFAWEVHESSRTGPPTAPYCGSRDGDIPIVRV